MLEDSMEKELNADDAGLVEDVGPVDAGLDDGRGNYHEHM